MRSSYLKLILQSPSDLDKIYVTVTIWVYSQSYLTLLTYILLKYSIITNFITISCYTKLQIIGRSVMFSCSIFIETVASSLLVIWVTYLIYIWSQIQDYNLHWNHRVYFTECPCTCLLYLVLLPCTHTLLYASWLLILLLGLFTR